MLPAERSIDVLLKTFYGHLTILGLIRNLVGEHEHRPSFYSDFFESVPKSHDWPFKTVLKTLEENILLGSLAGCNTHLNVQCFLTAT